MPSPWVSRAALPVALLLLAGLTVVALGVGDLPLGPARIWAGLWHHDELAATVLWRFGIDPATEIRDQTARPFRLSEGEPIHQLF